MKKVLLTAMAILSVASASVFGMYGNDSGWIDFLVHGNQLRARMDRFGVTIGNGTIKGTVGFKGNTEGLILSSKEGNVELKPTVSAGIGYTSPAFGIGVGYNYTYIGKGLDVHTPVLVMNAMNNMIRIALPFQIAAGDENKNGSVISSKEKYMGFSMDPQIRIYPGIDAVSQIRLKVKYGMVSYKKALNVEYLGSSLGFEFRVNFLKTLVGNVTLDPFFRVTYNTAIDGNNKEVSSSSYNINSKKGEKSKYTPYDVKFDIPLGLAASSDTVSLYLEPSLGYAFSQDASGSIEHALTWGAYGEIYVTPVKDLEWYFEANVGNYKADDNKKINNAVNFAASTGITWYLPSFGGDAQ